jgi:hypothetical protein
MFRGRPNPGPNQRPSNGGGINPWIPAAGGLLAGSVLFGSNGGGLGGGSLFSMLPLIIVGGAALGVVSILKK